MSIILNTMGCSQDPHTTLLVVADQRAQTVHTFDPQSARWETVLTDTALAEHAGLLQLPDGRIAFVDDAAGELVLLTPGSGRTSVERVPVAIPGEHLACSPDGRWLAVSTGAGDSFEPSSDQLTLVDLAAPGRPRARRVRTRVGEPGIALTDHEVLLRHRAPGAVQALGIVEVAAAGPHVPHLDGQVIHEVGDAGHGDAWDPISRCLLIATERGLERFAVEDGSPRPLGVVPWDAGQSGTSSDVGRAYYLRCCPRRRLVAATLRRGGEDPLRWDDWDNHLWVHHLDTGRTHLAPIGPGLVFRCALTPTALVTTRVHPDGDELIAHDLTDLRSRGTWSLPRLAHGPRRGHEPWDDADRRSVAACPEAETVLVTRGGHGQVHLVDVHAPGTPLRTFAAPSPLRDGGHVGWFAAPSAGGLDGIGR